MKKKETDIYSEAARHIDARRRKLEYNKGCFFAIFITETWTRYDCKYFGCLRAKTGCCKIYNKLKDTP